MIERPLTTLEAVLRIRSHLWAIVGAVAVHGANACDRLVDLAESRELDAVTDAEEVRHAVLLGTRDQETP